MMKKSSIYGIALGLYCLSIANNGCNVVSPNSTASSEVAHATVSPTVTAVSGGSQNNFVDFMGVTLQSSLSSEIRGKENEAVFLEDKLHKPDYAHPRYISLEFSGDYAKKHTESFFTPKIDIYKVDEFAEAFATSPDYVAIVSTELKKLSKILSTKPSALNDPPFIPYMDAGQAITARTKYLSFENGSGVFYLAKFNSGQPTLVDNSNLTYIFQGFTSDDKYYVVATFPLTASFLPPSTAYSYKGYTLPEFFYEPKSKDRNEIEYKHYLSKVKEDLESANEKDFDPGLDLIEAMISSLHVGSDVLR